MTVLSPLDGPLRPILSELGAQASVSRTMPDLGHYDAVVLNTVETVKYLTQIPPDDARRKVLFWVHESQRKEYFEKYEELKDVYSLPAKHVFVTERSRANWIDLPMADSVVIHNGLSVAAIRKLIQSNTRQEVRGSLGLNHSHFVVSLVGSINSFKNQVEFLRVASEIIRSYRGELIPHFLIAGFTGQDAVYEAKVFAELANHSNLAGHVHLLQKSVSGWKYYAASDAYLCPSYVESFGRTIVEAMAFGLPVIAYASDGIPEVLRNGTCGQLVPAGDWPLMASHLLQLMQDKAAAINLGFRGKQCVMTYYRDTIMLDRLAAAVNSLTDSWYAFGV